MEPPVTVSSVHQPVMGTTLELRISAASDSVARDAEAFAVAEAGRRERSLTVFDESSELCRWRAGHLTAPTGDLLGLLTAADRWQRRSVGAFNPLAGVLTRRWQRAAAEGEVPSRDELAALAASVAEPRFEVVDGAVHPLGDLRDLNLNALAKGFVVDRVATATMDAFDLAAITVNAGGDLVHHGSELVVGIEDPHRPYDNAEPLTRMRIGDRALATSGSSRRWFDVAGERFNQVLDPWTGWPVDEVAAVSVIARNAATADVVATILSVLPPSEAEAFADQLGRDPVDPVEAAYLRVGAEGSVTTNDRWRHLEA